MRSTFRILFYLNTSKRKKSGLCPVMGRITVDGRIAQFSLKEEAHPDQWDAKSGRARGKSREQIELNRKIEQTEQNIKNIYTQMVDSVGYVTAEQIKNELNGTSVKVESLLKLFMEHNMEYKKRIGIDRAESSYYNYENSFNNLSDFIKLKYEMEDYPLKMLNLEFIDKYDLYLRVDVNLNPNTIARHIIFLKKMIRRAMNQKAILFDPFPEYDPPKQKRTYKHISKEELKRIMTVNIESQSMRFVRDMFVFSCFTGLAYSDMRKLSEKHLRKEPDESIWIDIPRQKTEVESHIRLLDIPLSIIEKYRSERKSDILFHIPGKTEIHNSMRELEKLCGIGHLHFHMARHTFATQICLTNGVSMEALSKMMGHSSMRSTQIYAEITNQKVGEDMKKLVERIKEKNAKN